jgi:hypothetical protein
MAFELKPGAFSLFKNDKKTKETHPDWKGSIKLPDGQEYWFDAWNKTSTNSAGGVFISGKVGNPKQGSSTVDQPTAYQPFPPLGQAPNPLDDDIPF